MSKTIKRLTYYGVVLTKVGSILGKIIAIVFGLILLATPVLFGFSFKWEEQFITKFTVDYLGIILSSVSLVLVALTVLTQRRELNELSKSNNRNFTIHKNTYDAVVLSLIDKLLSDEMAVVRRTTETLREDLKSGRKTLVRYELKSIFIKQISDNWGKGSEEYKELMKSDIFKQFAAFTKLVRYFDMISYYDLNEKTASAIHFYYIWWRDFFETVRDIFEEAYEEAPKKHLSVKPNWIGMIDRLDRQMENEKLPLH